MEAYATQIEVVDNLGEKIATLTNIVDMSYKIELEDFISPEQVRFVASVLESELCNKTFTGEDNE